MIPLSYASILGGTITLIGTSTNLVVNGQYQVLTGKPGFALFDIAPIGLIVRAGGHAVRGVRGAAAAEGAPQPRPDLRRHAQLHLRGRGRARRPAGRQDHPAGGTAPPGAHLPRRDRARRQRDHRRGARGDAARRRPPGVRGRDRGHRRRAAHQRSGRRGGQPARAGTQRAGTPARGGGGGRALRGRGRTRSATGVSATATARWCWRWRATASTFAGA